MKHKIKIRRKDNIRQGYWIGRKLRKNYGSRFNEKDDLLRTLKFVESIDSESKIVNTPISDYGWVAEGDSWVKKKLKKKNLGSFTALGISKRQNIERIQRLNERRKWARELYDIDKRLMATIEGGQREDLGKQREELVSKIDRSRSTYGDPIFIKRKNFGSYELDRSDVDDIVIDFGRKVADKHRRQLAGLKGIAKDVDEKLAKEIPDDLGYITTKKGMRPIKIDEGAKSQIARDLIRTAENELVRQDIQEGLSKKLFGKAYFFELDKNQKSKVNRLIRKNMETNF